jgi:hypothetical protein
MNQVERARSSAAIARAPSDIFLLPSNAGISFETSKQMQRGKPSSKIHVRLEGRLR